MFIGHCALAFAVKKVEPRVRWRPRFSAAQLADTIWPVLLIGGSKGPPSHGQPTAVTPLRFDSYQWSHSLMMLAVYGVVFGANSLSRTKAVRAAVLLGLLSSATGCSTT